MYILVTLQSLVIEHNALWPLCGSVTAVLLWRHVWSLSHLRAKHDIKLHDIIDKEIPCNNRSSLSSKDKKIAGYFKSYGSKYIQ